MKTLRHASCWVCGRALGTALILWLSALALPTQATDYYVDEGVGNNSYDGLSDTVSGSDGPKFNVSAAISIATGGSTIEVDSGDYAESVWDSGTNSLTLNPQGDVTICGADLCAADTVGDGIPDWWRLEYFGTPTTTNTSSCASCEPTGDGFSNLQNYLSGADPTNSQPSNLPAAACFTNQYYIYGANFITIFPWTSQGIFYQGDSVTISNSIGTTVEVYDFHCNNITNAAPPVTLTNLAMGHYFVQVDGIPDTGGYGDRSQFSVWPQGYTNNPHADIGEPNTATFAESNRWVRLAPGFTRNGVAWSTISSNSAGTNDWTWVDQYLHGGPPLYAGRWANGSLADSNGNEGATAVPNPPASVKVFNIAVDHIGVTTNPSTLFSSPTVDETNTLDSWVQDVATIFSNAAARYTNSFVYEILNEPNFANVIFPTNQDVYDSDGAYPASLAVSASVRAIQFVCPTCQTWAPAASGLKNSLALFTNSYVVGGYTDANMISFHQGDALYGAIDAVLAYEGWLPTDSNMDIVASIYGKPFAITEAYPWSPDVLGKTSSWWVTTSPLPTNVPYALWNWQTMTFRFWKNLIESRSAGLSRQQTWLQIYDYDIDAQDPQHIENEGQDAYNGWDVGMEQWDIQGCGPLPTVDGQAMVSWWLTGGTSLTNWLSGTTIAVTNPAGGYTGTAGLHFWTWQFAGGSTNTFVWADEQITVTTNFGVGLTDIFSNEWTGPIGIEPVIAWDWHGP